MNTICTDSMMKSIYLNLVSDFRLMFESNSYAQGRLSSFLSGGIKGLREYSPPSFSQVSPALFKAEHQLNSFFKRYRHSKDLFSDEELLESGIKKFRDTQVRIAAPFLKTPLVSMVLKRASVICSDILGDYDKDEHAFLCRFGRRAAVGVPQPNTNLHVKLCHLSGSVAHIRWFKNHLRTDNLLLRAIQSASGKKRPSFVMCDTLKMSFVPKSYKALRSVTPDTVIGSFYTNGLGRLMAKKLRLAGLDIKRLQKRHGYLAKYASKNRKLVTADLSAASDSINLELLRELLPPDWFESVTLGRIAQVQILDDVYTMETVLTMGLGHTFPLQTLVFYSLLKAIAELGEVEGTISVYGDDLIYPSRMHGYVATLFPKLHLILNSDKTFVQDFFRESCGSDFYHGCDVRPFQPEVVSQKLSGADSLIFLFKLINGLSERWSREELPSTFLYLDNMIYLHADRDFRVPRFFPADSGIHISSYVKDSHVLKSTFHSAPLHPKYVLCYYWDKLRSGTSEIDVPSSWSLPIDSNVIWWKKKKKRKKSGDLTYVECVYTIDKGRKASTKFVLCDPRMWLTGPQDGTYISSSFMLRTGLERVFTKQLLEQLKAFYSANPFS